MMDAFLAMGGYAGFVWSSYALSLLVLVGAAFGTWRAYRRVSTRLEALEKGDR
jgi:heme exporter protein CcmD